MPFVPDQPVAQKGFVPDDESLAIRGLKQFVNVVPETLKETAYGLGGGKIATTIAAWKLNKLFKQKGIKSPSVRQLQKRLKTSIFSQESLGKVLPEFEVKPAETVGEKITDVAAGVSKFVAKLAMLRKVYPSASEAHLWEIENLSSGGTPGLGFLTQKVFSVPGQFIKGTTVAAKAGRIGAEAAGLGTISALEQKIDTGEIDWKAVAISAAIPVGLRTPGFVKTLITKRDPKVMKAISKVQAEKPKVPKEKFDTTSSANKEILSWAKKAKSLNKKERVQARKELHKEQLGIGKRYKEGRAPSLETNIRALRASKGTRAKIPEMTPLKLSDAQREVFVKKIEKVYGTDIFKSGNVSEALVKMQQGKIPTNYEFQLLEPILGRETTKKLYSELIKRKPFSGWELPALIIQGFKTKFGLDIQTFRQARSLALRHPIQFMKAGVANARAYLSNKYAESSLKKLKESAGYKESEKYLNYVGDTGYSSRRIEYYSLGLTERLLVSKYKPVQAWGKLLEASERGAVVGINTMMKSLWDASEKNLRRLNLTEAQRGLYRINRGKTINTFMKILRTKNPSLKKLQQAANYVLFSPSMTASRPLSIKALIANKGSRKYAAGVIATNLASIFAITAIPAIIANKRRLQQPDVEPELSGELNILSGNWGKIRYKDTVYDFSGGDGPFYRTLARIGVSSWLAGEQLFTGKEATEIANQKVVSPGETIKRYFETRETAALGYAKTMLTGKDWMDKPIPRFEATVRALSPEIIEAVVEAGHADGLWQSLAAFAGTTTSVGISTYPIKSTITRSNFRNILAKKEHNKSWSNLTKFQQTKLQIKYKSQFDELNQKIKEEAVESPPSYDRIREEEKVSGKKIRKKLSKKNQELVKGTSLNVSRMPKDFYLSDKRYQTYKELVAAALETRLNSMNLENKSRKTKIRLVELAVKFAKSKAWIELNREIKAGSL